MHTQTRSSLRSEFPFPRRRWVLGAVCLSYVLSSPSSAFAGEFNAITGKGWAAFRDLTNSEMSAKGSELRSKGMRPIDIDVYPVSGNLRYATVWQANDGRGWAQNRNMTSSGYATRLTQNRDRGYRQTDIEGYQSGGNSRYAAIWIENREGIEWVSFKDMTSSAYGSTLSTYRTNGWYLVDMEVYDTAAGLRYAGIWYRNTNNIQWAQLRNMTRSRYNQEVSAKNTAGFDMVDYERYKVGTATRYAAIWHRGDVSQRIRTNRNEKTYANYFREYRDDGYRVVDFERDGSNYGAIWVKSDLALADNPWRATIDSLLETYRSSEGVPGISAAVVKDGVVVYRSGVGEADQSQGLVAHGGTVYRIASISKVVGGTLFGRLEEQGRLRDGTPVSIQGADSTRRHLPAAPAFHTHTLRQLLNHSGCVPHWNTTPSVDDQTVHYPSQLSAVASIWGTSLINNCLVGVNGGYSTVGYTFIGAALEAATNRNISTLVREELAEPYGLDSLRVMYETSTLPANYERSVRYSSLGGSMANSNNSSKVLGGGLEGSVVDTARFGWLTLSGSIVSPSFRDTTLFTPQPGLRIAYGWRTPSGRNRRIVEHGGQAGGARGYLGVYRDEGLVIAILSNRARHSGLPSLADDIADLYAP